MEWITWLKSWGNEPADLSLDLQKLCRKLGSVVCAFKPNMSLPGGGKVETGIFKTTIGYKLVAMMFILPIKVSQIRNNSFAPSPYSI